MERPEGLGGVTLQTGAADAPARAFYAALGFAEEEVRLTPPLGGGGATTPTTP